MVHEDDEQQEPLLLEAASADQRIETGVCAKSRKQLSFLFIDFIAFVVIVGIVTTAVVHTQPSVLNMIHKITSMAPRSTESVGDSSTCAEGAPKQRRTELEALQLYSQLNFTANISSQSIYFTDEKPKWSADNKLKVFLVPHSHNDAGWGMTFKGYYAARTVRILDNMLKHMTEDKKMKFIWAETSFFDLWWSELTYEEKGQVKKLVESGQLEFVNGGWVMPDEASVHYYSYLTQMIEGHQWFLHHLNVTPKNSWTIDPFGLSSSFEYLINKAGMRRNVFLRTHYMLKQWFRQTRNLEFYWRQQWDISDEAVLCYMMPYESYETGDTCGPGHKVDICNSFNQLQHEWLDSQIAKNTLALLDQYRKKSMEFQTNNVLIPIGGDFFWQTTWEWTGAVENLRAAARYLAQHPELFAEMKIATLSEYFEAVENDINRSKFTPKTFSGDFFPYSDAGIDYWSGYFTSRIFHKVSERELLTALRSAQLLYTYTVGKVAKIGYFEEFGRIASDLLSKILTSRRSLSLFQHHDGISGTSRDYVVRDYANKIITAMRDSFTVMQTCLQLLSNFNQPDFLPTKLKSNGSSSYYEAVLSKDTPTSLWKHKVIQLNAQNNEEIIAIFNPLEYDRTELVRVVVSTTNVKVIEMNGHELQSEVHPDLDRLQSQIKPLDGSNNRNHSTQAQVTYDLYFPAAFKALQVRHFTLVWNRQGRDKPSVKIVIHGRNLQTPSWLLDSFADVQVQNQNGNYNQQQHEDLQIGNRYTILNFTHKGALKGMTVNGSWSALNVSFHHYNTNSSGLYSFIPSGPAVPLPDLDLPIIEIHGHLLSYLEVAYDTVRHRITLQNHKGSSNVWHVQNIVNIRKKTNYELIMRLESQIQSGDDFYTDSNGFQIMKRKRFPNVPIQGHYYPLAASGFIEDDATRLTILTGQPCGGASLEEGELEVMLDRKTAQDDHHGIGQGGTDNVPVITLFKIVLETAKSPPSSQNVPSLSLQSHLELSELLHPLHVFHDIGNHSQFSDYQLGHKVSCDVKLAALIPLPKFTEGTEDSNDTSTYMQVLPADTGLILHRVAFDGRFDCLNLLHKCSSDFGQVDAADLLKNFNFKMWSSSISFVKTADEVMNSFKIFMDKMTLSAFRIDFYFKGLNETVIAEL